MVESKNFVKVSKFYVELLSRRIKRIKTENSGLRETVFDFEKLVYG